MSFDPLYPAMSSLLLHWHRLFGLLGVPERSGLNWSLSIVFVVFTARSALFLLQRVISKPSEKAGVLALIAGFPVFIGLFHVIRRLPNGASHAVMLHAPLAVSLHSGAAQILLLGGHVLVARLVIAALVVLSATACALAQRHAEPAPGRLIAVAAPVSVLVSGAIFPLGLVLYGPASNLWTLGQQRWLRSRGTAGRGRLRRG